MSRINAMQAGAMKTGTIGAARQHRQVTLGRFAPWIRFAGAVTLQASLMILCFRAVGDKFTAAGVIAPLAIAIFGLAMIGGGHLVSRHSRPGFMVRPRLHLVGDTGSEIAATTRRSAA